MSPQTISKHRIKELQLKYDTNLTFRLRWDKLHGMSPKDLYPNGKGFRQRELLNKTKDEFYKPFYNEQFVDFQERFIRGQREEKHNKKVKEFVK